MRILKKYVYLGENSVGDVREKGIILHLIISSAILFYLLFKLLGGPSKGPKIKIEMRSWFLANIEDVYLGEDSVGDMRENGIFLHLIFSSAILLCIIFKILRGPWFSASIEGILVV